LAKGALAKEALIKRFATAVGNDYCGELDKKYYFWSVENGERVQIAVSMTCPKTPIEFQGHGGDLNFDDDEGGGGGGSSAPAASPVAMSEDEAATLERLMKELDL
jgi:hypothetical protein